jgi:hypothetical protein
MADPLHGWMLAQRTQLANGRATAWALACSLKRWPGLLRFVYDGRLPIDNSRIENQMRAMVIVLKSGLFAGSLLAGQRGRRLARRDSPQAPLRYKALVASGLYWSPSGDGYGQKMRKKYRTANWSACKPSLTAGLLLSLQSQATKRRTDATCQSFSWALKIRRWIFEPFSPHTAR